MTIGLGNLLPLVGVLIGASLGFVFASLKDVLVYRRERAALAAALQAEAQSILRQVCFTARVIAENENIAGNWPGVPSSNDLDSFYPYHIPSSIVYMASVAKIGTLGSKAASKVVEAFQRIEEARLGLGLYTASDEDGDQIWTAAAVLKPAKQLVEMMPELSATLAAIAREPVDLVEYDLGNTDRALAQIGGSKQLK